MKLKYILVLVALLPVMFTFSVTAAFIQGGTDSLTKQQAKSLSKKQLIQIVDSLLERKFISSEDIEKVRYFNNLLKNKNEVTYETEYNDLSNLHFYSEAEEKMLFPPYPLDSMPRNFDLLLEPIDIKNYTNPFNGVLTSYYGWRDKRMHKGIDIDLNKGDPVLAAFDGKVRIANKNNGGFGNVVIIMHPNGLETVYAHLSKIKVKAGQVVLSGQVIGLGGNTGRSHGSHLHFETRYKGHAINPLMFINYHENKLYSKELSFKVNRKGISVYPANASFHVVSKGENWNKIALEYQTSVNQLLMLNGCGKRYYLKPGQKLRVY